MAKLSEEQIGEKMGEIEGWEREGGAITKNFDRGDFVGSVKFVDSIVEPAEEMNHHPDLSISWSEVKVTLATHSEGGLTDNDFELAAKIDALA
jgi:4a-hydroxytetrahydrobiopterin dehydratase